MDMLKLVALDEEDLAIVSAHVQDAVARVGDLRFEAPARRFLLPMNRFAWETQQGWMPGRPQRRNAVLHFNRVTAVRSAGVPRKTADEVLSLLALRFVPGEAPAGVVELVFSGAAAIHLEVECIEARLTDLGGAWEASSRPRHRI
jgi:hypothetical protein